MKRNKLRNNAKLQFKGRHMQHTKEFRQEMNAIKLNFTQPFRYYDEVWIVGRFKGVKLEETPNDYIKWSYSEMKMSENCRNILRKYLEREVN